MKPVIGGAAVVSKETFGDHHVFLLTHRLSGATDLTILCNTMSDMAFSELCAFIVRSSVARVTVSAYATTTIERLNRLFDAIAQRTVSPVVLQLSPRGHEPTQSAL